MKQEKTQRTVLIGNAFPLSLIRRRVEIQPCSEAAFKAAVTDADIHSFWGHSNTLECVNDFAGIDLTPSVALPTIGLSDDHLPILDDITFTECYIVSPDYIHGFRPGIGEEVSSESIRGWQRLKIYWK